MKLHEKKWKRFRKRKIPSLRNQRSEEEEFPSNNFSGGKMLPTFVVEFDSINASLVNNPIKTKTLPLRPAGLCMWLT